MAGNHPDGETVILINSSNVDEREINLPPKGRHLVEGSTEAFAIKAQNHIVVICDDGRTHPVRYERVDTMNLDLAYRVNVELQNPWNVPIRVRYISVKYSEGVTDKLKRWLPCTDSDTLNPGPRGLSAYQVATSNGYRGTVSQWLATLVADSAYDVAKSNGYTGTQSEWVLSLTGSQGPSAYDIAVRNGYSGTQTAWIASLKGADNSIEPDKYMGKDVVTVTNPVATRPEETGQVTTTEDVFNHLYKMCQ